CVLIDVRAVKRHVVWTLQPLAMALFAFWHAERPLLAFASSLTVFLSVHFLAHHIRAAWTRESAREARMIEAERLAALSLYENEIRLAKQIQESMRAPWRLEVPNGVIETYIKPHNMVGGD